MRRRLLALLVPALALLAIGLLVPYSAVAAHRATQATYSDRYVDGDRFASIVAGSGSVDDRLQSELTDYSRLYGSPVWVIGLSAELLHDPGSAIPDEVMAQLPPVFAGSPATEAATVYPWSTGPMYVMHPVGHDSQVTAAIVIAAPTDALRAHVLRTWLIAVAVLIVPLGLLVLGIVPMTRWALRPVERLGQVAAKVRSGDLDARADAAHGPPELRVLTESFNDMVAAVQSSLHRQEAFAADAAHQLRNPLTGLQLAVENLQPWLTEPDAREAHEDAVAEIDRMAGTLEAMLTAATLAGNVRIPDSEAPPLAEVIAEGEARWAAVAQVASMRFEVGHVDGDAIPRQPPGGLSVVLDELISNAARLCGGTTITLTATRVAAGGLHGQPMVEVVVADDGIGIPQESLERATGRFWRAEHHQNVPGTGLGLAILSDVLADAGGALHLRANTPHGLRAVVALPTVG